jgi:hypothetical protein
MRPTAATASSQMPPAIFRLSDKAEKHFPEQIFKKRFKIP